MTSSDWPFDHAKNVGCVTTRQVLRENAPITVVIHYSDDHSWAFLGGDDFKVSDGLLIAMSEAAELDPTLFEVADLEPGWTAQRDHVCGSWTREFAPEM
ncbi:MAG: hypothetical protein JST54_29910 [Deltaproteobacteria bacterium]|nr:hypothetical protein [Deltaproteobacteria bacterium]